MDENFLKAIKCLPKGVYVITSSNGKELGGLTAGWVSRISHHPAMFMVSIAPQRHTYSIITEGRNFCINIMSKKGVNIAKRFGNTTGWNVNKFSKIGYSRGLTGAPILKDAAAYIECKLVKRVKSGDHIVLLGKVVDAKMMSKDKPVLFRHNDLF